MACGHHWTVTSPCPKCQGEEIERLTARVREVEAWLEASKRRASRLEERIVLLDAIAQAACDMRNRWDDTTSNPLAGAIVAAKMAGWEER